MLSRFTREEKLELSIKGNGAPSDPFQLHLTLIADLQSFGDFKSDFILLVFLKDRE